MFVYELLCSTVASIMLLLRQKHSKGIYTQFYHILIVTGGKISWSDCVFYALFNWIYRTNTNNNSCDIESIPIFGFLF